MFCKKATPFMKLFYDECYPRKLRESFKKTTVLVLIGSLIFFAPSAYAIGSIGELADALLGPLSAIRDIVDKVCYIIGFSMIIGSGMQYKRHRDNPSEVRLGQVILLLIFGIIVVLLPLIPQWLTSKTISVP